MTADEASKAALAVYEDLQRSAMSALPPEVSDTMKTLAGHGVLIVMILTVLARAGLLKAPEAEEG